MLSIKNSEASTRLSFCSWLIVEESWTLVIGDFFEGANLFSDSLEDTTSVDVTVTLPITERGAIFFAL
jgi:hypothetical protein